MITLKILLWILIIVAFAMIDCYMIKKKGKAPHYWFSFINRGWVWIVYSSAVWSTHMDLRTLNLFLFCVTSFWLLFDILMGSLLHGDPFYVGQNSGWLDRFAHRGKWSNIAYWTLKILALYVAIKTCINIYTRFDG